MAIVQTAVRGDRCCPCVALGMHFIGCPCTCHAPDAGPAEIGTEMTVRDLRLTIRGIERCASRLSGLAAARPEFEPRLSREVAELLLVSGSLSQILERATAEEGASA